jgi:hypothetical protein
VLDEDLLNAIAEKGSDNEQESSQIEDNQEKLFKISIEPKEKVM